MPFLLPPPEFRPIELKERGLLGTCEVQICRSAGPWSLGTATKVEHSIQDAYLKGSYPCSRVFIIPHVDYSDPTLPALRLHREPILHHVVRIFILHSSLLDHSHIHSGRPSTTSRWRTKSATLW